MRNNPNLYLVNMSAYLKFGEILSICSQDTNVLSRNEILNNILTSVKCNSSMTNARKMIGNNPTLDLVDINPYTKFGEILSICSEDIEQKRKSDGRNDRQPKSSIAPLFKVYSPCFSKWGYNKKTIRDL